MLCTIFHILKFVDGIYTLWLWKNLKSTTCWQEIPGACLQEIIYLWFLFVVRAPQSSLVVFLPQRKDPSYMMAEGVVI